MGYFASGCPKSYVLPHQATTTTKTAAATDAAAAPSALSAPSAPPVHAIRPDPSDRYVLTVSSRALHIWSAGHHRVLQARFVLSPRVHADEGGFVDAAWAPDSTTVIAALSHGLVLLLRVAPHPPRSLLSFALAPPAALIQPPPLYALALTRAAELRVAHAADRVTALAACPAGALVATAAAALVCVAWDADVLWRAHVPELLRHNDAIAKMGLVAPGAPARDPRVAAIQAGADPDDAGGVRALDYNRELGFCAVVLGAGPALLLAMHSAGHTRPSAIDGRWLRSSDAVSIALEPRRMLASVGLRNGDIEQYYIGVPAGDRCPLMRTLSLSNWYFDPEDVGAPVVLRWTPDGSALVVGWERRGLAVWSVSGCRLMCTLSQVGGPLPTTPAQRHKEVRNQSVYPMEQGVLAAAWGPHGLFLWASPRHTAESPPSMRDVHFMEFNFFKGSSRGAFCESDSSRLAMFGSDRVLLLSHADGAEEDGLEDDGTPGKLFSWQHLIIPHDYLWRNWPPTNIAISADASSVAIAGEHGVAICQVRTQRWRVFGDLEHDRRIRCCALAWVGKTIVIGNEVLTTSARDVEKRRYELLFYPRDQFDSSALRAQRDLPSRPVLTDVRADGYLLVICEDAQVFLFRMKEHYNRSRLDLRMIYTLLLPTREGGPMYHQDISASADAKHSAVDDLPPPAPGGGISQAKIFPPLTHAGTDENGETPIPTHIMLLRSTGSLILLDTERMVSTALLRYVERFWYTPVDCTPFDMMSHRPVWWAYGDDGLHVCFQDGMPRYAKADQDIDELDSGQMSFSSRRKKVDVEQWFELDPEVYPLTIMSKYGMLLGATQGLTVSNVEHEVNPWPSHTIQVKRLPILHTLLRHILMKPHCNERVALQIALKCVSQPQFVDSLEWLLYEAVLEHEDDGTITSNGDGMGMNGDAGPEKHSADRAVRHGAIAQGFPESPRRKKAGSSLFPRVIRLLKYFGEYEDVVVRCARKLDSKRWPLLFSLAGEPAALLEQCFVSGRLRTAACLLVILQEMWGFISSTPHSLRLVGAALSRGELDLAADLANFLAKADRAGMLNSSQLRTNEDVSWIAEAAQAPKGSALNKALIRQSSREESSDRIPAVDLAVLNHARSLLIRMDLRTLVALSVKMNFPLSEWLKRELKGKNASRPFVRDFGSTILSLHRQFQYPEPDLMDVRRAMKDFNPEIDGPKSARSAEEATSTRSNGSLPWADEGGDVGMTPRSAVVRAAAELVAPGVDTVFGSQLPPPPSVSDNESLADVRARAKKLCSQELNYMMTVARLARVPDITLCCATLLLDVSVLRMVLRGHEELFGPFVAALNEFNVSGYDALVAVLNEVAVPR